VVHDLDDGQLYLLEKKPRALLPANLVNRSEQYTPETTAYALLPDMSVVLAAKGGIFLIRDAKVVKALTKLKYSYALMGMRLSVWLVALALLGLSVYYFRFFMKTFYENRTPEILRDSVLIMLSIAFSALVVAGEIYGSMMDHYLRNTGNSLIQYTELAFEKIKPINLDAITSVRSYDSEDYRQLHDKIWRLLDAFDEQSGCPYYFMLYKFDGGKLREVLDTDTYGSGARFQVVPREFTDEVMKIIKAKPQDNDGRIVTSDTYAGKWMFTAKPVYGADGKLSGVFEVGTDLFSIEKTSMSILTEAILKTISFIIVFILIMLETISFRSRKETVKTRMSGSTVRMLMLLTVCSSMTSFSVVPLLAAGFKTTGLNISMAQAMALPGIVEMMLMIVVNLYGARLVERFGWMPQYITGMLLIASGSLMAFFSPDFMWFLASRILSGLGVGLAFNATKMLYAFRRTGVQGCTFRPRGMPGGAAVESSGRSSAR
jgi:MFS family permease